MLTWDDSGIRWNGAAPAHSDDWAVIPSRDGADRRIVVLGWAMDESAAGARLRWDRDAATRIAEQLTTKPWDELFAALDAIEGSFAAIVHERNGEGGRLLLRVDRFGEYPIYHAISKKTFFAGFESLALARAAGARLDPGAAIAIASFEFIPGGRTAADGVVEIEAGDGLRMERSASGSFVSQAVPGWRPAVAKTAPGTEEELSRALAENLRAMASRFGQAVLADGNARIAIPLSGGLDSRLLLALFREGFGSRVVALAYGDEGAHDVELSRRAAAAAGVQHRFSEFKPGEALSNARRTELANAIGLTTRLTLADGGLLLAEGNAVGAAGGSRDVGHFLPGHSGDGISGSKLRAEHANHTEPRMMADALSHAWRRTFSREILQMLLRPRYRGLAQVPFELMLRSCEAQQGRDGFENMQRWMMREQVRRRVLTELPIYRKRARALLPFYDRGFAEFLSTLPAEMLLGQRLYNVAAFSHILTGANEPLAEVPFQGRTRAEMTGAGSTTARFARRVGNRILREVAVERLERRLTATPLVAFYRRDAAYRESIWEELRNAKVLPEIFDREKLFQYLETRLGSDDALTTTGIWGLLTVERIGAALG